MVWTTKTYTSWKWHQRFAWIPRIIEERECGNVIVRTWVWLQMIERVRIDGGVGPDAWMYRLKGETK